MSPDDLESFEDCEYMMEFSDPLRERGLQIIDMANLMRFQNALKEIVNVLGPDDLVDGCPDCHAGCPGLLAEAGEALRIAKEALAGKHVLPEENT